MELEQTSGHRAGIEPSATRGGWLPTGVTALAPVPAARRGEAGGAAVGHEAAERSVAGVRRRTGTTRALGLGEALRALHRITFQVRGIARTLADTVDDRRTGHRPAQMFLDRYAATLETAGDAVKCFAAPGVADGSAEDGARERLRRAIDDAAAWHTMMTGEIEQGALTEPGAWHVYGSLMTDAERLLADLDRAARSATTPQIPHP
ncbi:hypothetical protein [Streptomyces sp. NPDC014622]|uniref:hypothetical protein n=1 Tax=Streptomyces sp. NPDC014622 TaxID=3364874 RepID=UPI0036FA6810